MEIVYLQGLLGSDDLVSGQDPDSWRAAILALEPNGEAPFTALTSRIKTRSMTNRVHHWWTDVRSAQRATLNADNPVYTDSGLTTPYVSGGAAGDTLYLKLTTAAERLQFVAGHVVLLRYTGTSTLAPDWTLDTRARVTGIGATYVTVKLLEADNNSSTHTLANANLVMVIGTMFGEGSGLPTSISQQLIEMSNRIQIWKTPYKVSNTVAALNLRTGKQVAREKLKAAMTHAGEMEKSFLMGLLTSGTDADGEPMTSMMGLDPCIRQYAPENVFDFVTDDSTAYAGKTWKEVGGDWLREKIEILFRYGKRRKTVFCGSGFLLGIDIMARTEGYLNLVAGQTDFGLDVHTLISPFGKLDLVTHPWMTQDASLRNRGLVVEFDNISYMPLRDTQMKKIAEDGVDAERGYFLTEATLEIALPQTMGILDGVGAKENLAA